MNQLFPILTALCLAREFFGFVCPLPGHESSSRAGWARCLSGWADCALFCAFGEVPRTARRFLTTILWFPCPLFGWLLALTYLGLSCSSAAIGGVPSSCPSSLVFFFLAAHSRPATGFRRLRRTGHVAFSLTLIILAYAAFALSLCLA